MNVAKALAIACTLGFAHAGAAEVPRCLADQDYYVSGGRCVYLSPLATARAFRVRDGALASFRAELDEILGLEITSFRTGPRENPIVIVRRDVEATDAWCQRALQKAELHDAIELELPVYQTNGIDVVLQETFIVQYDTRKLPMSRERRAFLAEFDAEPVFEESGIDGQVLVRFPGTSPRAALRKINEIRARPEVEFAEPDLIRLIPTVTEVEQVTLAGAAIPELPGRVPRPDRDRGSADAACQGITPLDSLWQDQWALCNVGSYGTLDADIDATEAWVKTQGSSDIVIAVIDDGVDVFHPEFQGRVLSQYDATLLGATGPNTDDYHGTAVAGIAAANASASMNTTGIAGVSWKSKIFPVRMGYTDENHDHMVTKTSFIARAIRKAAEKAQVLNNSWHFDPPSDCIDKRIREAIVDHGRVLVFSVGNFGGAVGYPANLTLASADSEVRDALIAVSATDNNDMKYPASNFGPEVRLAAPGQRIATTDIAGPGGVGDGDYVYFGQTSAAAAFVSGAAALLLAVRPDASPAQVRKWLEKGAEHRDPTVKYNQELGFGRLNVARALEAATSAPMPPVVSP